ncbi:MAG: hypothetical protein UT40_C0011G0047 [Candidatus Woesebacteria bacterium GW2011_GWA1_39_21b]|uniref:Uncharacterized protein n=2 Tax=Patescibacteria group TaxID=1783273 RepID=A0A1G2QFI2_9BACT|nr:MAG: hypothetical protein UT40_C0011G0047 [Candidatus Woesebacteria bacterium GW2011_GWA1_39_21b]KKS77222.1 MAG: hypothetical protein UV50_C0008G0084 [Parcubacteria group bacterium GW2011_GWB1_42_9]KKS89796.1 MAG: hypothetical protein UV64_C0001G0055 [Parcubacteria group bacterium GW2011_GWC1_43_11b]OHA59364.1 MAG: hypothetical protein A2370_00240 [Candidatus Vogelbacteria bacterium RIFOXYB1_FULL_42_16]
MFQEFFLKKMLQSKGVSADQIDFFLDLIKKNPDLFQKIASEIEQKMKSEGKSEMQAAQEVMGKYKDDLAKIASK